MDSRKVLSSLCYFSIFFAGFIFPLVVWLASGDEITKQHAKKSLLSHLIPLFCVPLIGLIFIFEFVGLDSDIPVFSIISMIALAIVSLIVVIWNIVKGVKVLIAE
ncbi:DUF4870 domain-containing protein [Neobacillus dielmonensis]|uniref:DUF4870 domain-containing protein n=1 Tax=Neobacillus dielmonensis TaxID=1347369 RepID=UPI0005A9312D|nr:DUF4870 domain-containing protein [Neobacillus dielmonensis]